MSWKKSVLSYPIWFAYTVMTGVVLVGLADLFCSGAGIPFYWGVSFVALYGLIVCGLVILLHRFAKGYRPTAEGKREHLLVLEGLLFLILLAAGIAFRAWGVGSGPQSSEYYDMAKVVAGQGIPQTVHGAVYFYVQALHVLFGLLGNHFQAGIWFQIVLQLTGLIVMYFTVRRLAGTVAALVALGFGMCAPYIVRCSLVLSPDMLHFLILSVSGALIARLGGARFQEGVPGRRLRLPAFFCMGVLASVCCYLDISGILILLLAFGAALCHRRQAPGKGRKAAAAVLCAVGASLGLAACFSMDALFSGKPVLRVANAWLGLYQPEGFRLPVVLEEAGFQGGALLAEGASPVVLSGSLVEVVLLFALLAFGIFSFWCDRRRERISVGMISVCGMAAAGCYGIFTDDMPGFFYLYLLLAVLGALGLGQCFQAARPGGATEPAGAGEAAVSERGASGEADLEPGDGAEGERMPIGPEKPVEEAEAKEAAASEYSVVSESVATESGKRAEGGGEREVHYLENPLPLPKKHVKRVMDYPLSSPGAEDDFDYSVADDDDFDI